MCFLIATCENMSEFVEIETGRAATKMHPETYHITVIPAQLSSRSADFWTLDPVITHDA